jgi:cell division protein FtsW
MIAARNLLLISIACIFAMGIVMIFNTSSAEVLDHDLTRSTHHAITRHILYAFLGCGLGFGAYLLGYRTLLSLVTPLLILFCVLLVLAFVPGIGMRVNGAFRWIRIGSYTLQPSEFAKVLVPAYFIQQLIPYRAGELPFPTFLRTLGVISVPILLILVEPDNGTVGIIGLTLLGAFLLVGVPFRYWMGPMVALVLIAGIAATQLPYVQSRLQVYLNPELDVLGRGHQPLQSRIAAGSGGLFGVGPGQSLQKLSYLPEAQNDYIAAIYAEEFGFLGTLALIILYMTTLTVGYQIALQCRDRAGALLAAMLTLLLGIQIFLNLGVVSGLLPSTGLNLPFFSQGGSSLIANLLVVGVLLDIGRHTYDEISCR